jgi:hypothetical protein
MKLFFGKISTKIDKIQIDEGYYRATKESSWFNGIQPGDYSFTIGGGKIQLWRAKEWSKKDGLDILRFDVINNNLGINTKQLTAIKYFTLNMELVVLTVRSTAKSKKAFFPIQYTPEFTEDILLDNNTYKNPASFRKIHILSAPTELNIESDDIQLYKDNNEWRIVNASFIAQEITSAFHDNTNMLGSGQSNKDKTIEIISLSSNVGKKLDSEELSILQVYDLFCCNYISKETPDTSEDEIRDDLDVVNYGSLNVILYGPPGTGKTYEVINLMHDLDTNEKVGVQIEPRSNLNLERTFWHLAPGRNGYLWETLKKGNHLGYEWCDKTLGDLKKLDPSTENHRIRRRFSEVKKGDYLCIIRGRQCLAIAEAKAGYDFSNSNQGSFDFQTVEVKWLDQFETPILLNTTSTKTFSGISGGQRWKSLQEGLLEKGFTFGSATVKKAIFKRLYKFTTFHQSYSYEDFIEGIKPRLSEDKNEDDLDQSTEIEYEIKPGIFYNACDRAAQLSGYSDLSEAIKDSKENRSDKFSKASPYYLIIDEINRGNVANIFGELITLIENDKRLGGDQETIVSLPYSKEDFGVPGNLIIIGTMNTADRSVEALDSALRRRFTFIGKAPEPDLLSQGRFKNDEIALEKMLRAINNRIELLIDKDHLIGHSYFMGIKTLTDIQTVFKNKIIPLLEEYFYGKPQMIGLILGPAFITQKDKVTMFKQFDTDFSDISERKRFVVNTPQTWAGYRSIYENN